MARNCLEHPTGAGADGSVHELPANVADPTPLARRTCSIRRCRPRRPRTADVSVRDLYVAADRAGGAGSSSTGAAIVAPRVHT